MIFPLLLIGGVIFGVYLIFKFIFHFIGSLMPLMVFYLLPFVAGSFLFGFLISISVAITEERKADFRALSVAIPLLAFILYFAVGAPIHNLRYTVKETAIKEKLIKGEKPPEPTVTVEELS